MATNYVVLHVVPEEMEDEVRKIQESVLTPYDYECGRQPTLSVEECISLKRELLESADFIVLGQVGTLDAKKGNTITKCLNVFSGKVLPLDKARSKKLLGFFLRADAGRVFDGSLAIYAEVKRFLDEHQGQRATVIIW